MFLSDEKCAAIDRRVAGNPAGRVLTSGTVLAFFYGIFLFLYEIKFLRRLVPAVHPVLIAWAAALVLYDLLIRKVWRKISYYPIFLLFGICAALTAVIRWEVGPVGNVKALVMSVLPLAAFYPVCFRGERTKTMLTALLGAAVVMLAASVTGVVLYLKRFGGTVTFLGMEEYIGFRLYDERFENSGIIHYGIYSDTNHAAAYACVFAAYSAGLYLACRREIFDRKWKNRWGKVFAAANFIAQAGYFPLANSRGGWLALWVAGLLALFFYLLCAGRSRGKRVVRTVAAALVSVMTVALVCLLVLALRSGLSKASMLAERTDALPTAPAVETAAQPDSFDKAAASATGGRLTLWGEALEIYARHPIFGIGPGNERYYAQRYLDGGVLSGGKAIHNSYLDLLVSYGAVGFGVLMAFWILCAVQVIRKLFSNRRDAVDFWMLGGVLVAACAAFLLSCAFISTTAMYFVLLILTGYLTAERKSP